MAARDRRTEDVIKWHWESLSKSQQAFARLVIDEPHTVAVSSAGVLGRRLGISTSTVVRAATALGYEGYPDLQRTVQREQFERSSLLDRLEATERSASGSSDSVIRYTFAANVQALQDTMAGLHKRMFDRFVRMITRSRRVYVFGLGLSYAPAHVMAMGLRQAGCDARIAIGSVSDIADDLHGADGKDLLLAIAMPRYPSRTLTALDFAKQRRLARAAITDSAASPLATRSEQVLYVQQAEVGYFKSVIPTLAVVNAVVSSVAVAAGKRAHDSLALMDEEWRESFAFYTE